MFRKIFKINLCLLFLTTISFAEIVKNIEVVGNKRISKESILVFGNILINEDYNDDSLNLLLKNLYGTNFFKQVKLNINNNILYIDVVENPIIEDLEIRGVKNKKMVEALLDSMKLKSRKSYIESVFQKDVNLIKNMIKSSGYYFSDIKTSIINNEDQNSIRIIYDIDLGKKAKINEIVFLGDKKIKDRKLRNVITSEISRFWKFISNKVYLDTQRINLDKRLLTNYYKNLGFYNAKIENSFVEFKDNGSFKLIFNINAGEKFTFNKLNLIIPIDYDSNYFISINNLLNELENELYSLDNIDKILKRIDKIALSKQYEFIDATVSEEIIDGNKLDLTITMIETQKFYIEKINVFGNEHTLEEVIRNTFIIDEGDPFNKILFNKTINNLKAKNFFTSVKSKVKDGSTPNLKIININVEEKATGEISLGAGVGTSGGQIGGGIKENNFLGKGISLDTNLIFSENSIKGNFIYAKPNFNYTDNTLFTSLSSTTTDNLVASGYKSRDMTFSLGTSFMQYENLNFRPEISTSLEKLETNSSATASLKKQAGNYFDIYFNYGIDYDLRNKTYKPNDGYRTYFSQELPLTSDNYEILNTFETTKYTQFPAEMVGKFSFYAKTINAISNEDVRISKRLFIPSRKLRGFESGKVGPVANNDYIGGNYVTAINLLTTLPQILPSFQNTDFALFFDAANIWGVDYDGNIDDNGKIRSSTGVSLDVLTPVGPLNFSLSYPITKSTLDKTETFRFNLGTTF
jgi:outer membrane protein insertion porin family